MDKEACRWRAGRRGGVENLACEDGVSGGDGCDLSAVGDHRVNDDQARAQRAQRVAREAVIVSRRRRETARLEPVRVVIVVDGDRIAREIVPTRVAEAGTDDRGEEQRGCAFCHTPKKAQPSHQLNDSTTKGLYRTSEGF